MDRAASLPTKRAAKPSRGARRFARELADILPPRNIVFQKTPQDTLEATYVQVPLKPGQLSGPKNMFDVLFKGEEEVAERAAASSDDGEDAAAEGDDDGESAAAEGDDEDAAADGDDDDKAAAAEGDDEDAAAEGDRDEA